MSKIPGAVRAADSIGGDSAVVMIRAGTQPPMFSSTKRVANGNTGRSSAARASGTVGDAQNMPVNRMTGTPGTRRSASEPARKGFSVISTGYNFDWGNFGIGMVVIKAQHTILLGQTKYYEALVDQSDPSKLDIQGLKDPNQADGNRVNAQFTVTNEEGDKPGVYWENKDQNGNTLPSGLIRLVGRYWRQEVTYKVGLTATSGTASGRIDIEVKKPSRLGNEYAKAKDVFDNETNIDDTCIVYGGMYGIPPQLIKGQIEKEARTHDFGGDIGIGFAPAYRYEPFTAQFAGRRRGEPPGSWSNSPFYVTATTMGSGDPVPDHKNLQYISYPKEPVTVWYMVAQYSQLTGASAPGGVTLYAKRNPDGTMDFASYGYVTVQGIYNSILDYFQKGNSSTSSDYTSRALDSITTYLRNDWNGGVKHGTRGLQNIIAQTRIASSYGLLQMMYATALKRQYTEDARHSPEDLNVNSILFPFAMKHEIFLLQKVLNENPNGTNNWSIGYDKAFLQMYRGWNPMASYAPGVIQDSRLFPPQP